METKPVIILSEQKPAVKKELHFIRKYFSGKPCYISGDEIVLADEYDVVHKVRMPIDWNTVRVGDKKNFEIVDEKSSPDGLCLICFGDKISKWDIDIYREAGWLPEDKIKTLKDMVWVNTYHLPDDDYMASVIVDRITEFYTRPE